MHIILVIMSEKAQVIDELAYSMGRALRSNSGQIIIQLPSSLEKMLLEQSPSPHRAVILAIH